MSFGEDVLCSHGQQKDGGYVNKLPVLDGANYDYWKAKMVTFLKSIDNKTWKVVIKGRKHLVNVYQDGTSSLNLKVEWIDTEVKLYETPRL